MPTACSKRSIDRLVAAIAGFGMISLGESLSTFYTAAGDSFDPGAQFPSQPGGLGAP